MQLACYNSYLEIDVGILRSNIRSIKSVLPAGTQLIPVLKGNAYGLGAEKVAQVLVQEGGIQTFAVAQVGEAVQLRNVGITQDILVLGAFPLMQLPLAVEHNLLLTVFDIPTVRAVEREAASQGRTVSVHIKIETGLNRIGVKPGDALAALLNELKNLPHIQVKGCFTHFVDGRTHNSPSALRQFDIYQTAVTQIRAAGFEIPLCHVCNSGASEWFTDGMLDGVRLGRRLYMNGRDDPIPAGMPGAVEEVASWRTTIVNLHDVEVGEYVGYDGDFVAERPTTVATLCVGYGDGLFVGFMKSKTPCLVKGQLTRYIGICMDQCFLDVTGMGCKVGDEVTIFGRSSDGSFLSAQALARSVGGREGVFFSDSLSDRVERRYINE